MVLAMSGEEYEAAVAAFIRSRGVTRCPTACVLPTQASPDPGDRAALARHAQVGGDKGAVRQRRFSRSSGSATPDDATP
jgi:hypothetical protein